MKPGFISGKIYGAFLVSLLLILFSLFIHTHFPIRLISFVCLLIAAFLMVSDKDFGLQYLIGINKISGRYINAVILGIIFGVLLGFWYRYQLVIQFIPRTLSWFVVVAALVGITEELIFRGYIQGMLVVLPKWLAIIASSLLHTVYKTSLFVLPVSIYQVNIPLLFIWTFLGGLVFGWLKEYSRSTIPPAIAHAIFDIIAYAEYTHAPWWVW